MFFKNDLLILTCIYETFLNGKLMLHVGSIVLDSTVQRHTFQILILIREVFYLIYRYSINGLFSPMRPHCIRIVKFLNTVSEQYADRD